MDAPQAIMMSSKEIAELVGKKHPHVIRDIWSNIEQLYDVDKDDPKMDFNDFKGISVNKQIINGRYVTSEILLDRRHTEILITGYDVKRRAAVIDRWFELEQTVRLPKESGFDLERAKFKLSLVESSLSSIKLSDASKIQVYRNLLSDTGLPDLFAGISLGGADMAVQTPPAPTQQLALLVKPETSSLAALLREYNIDSPSASVFTMLYKHGFVERRFKASQLKNRGVKTKEGYWYLTEKGLYYGENANTSRERGETHPKFYDNRFGELLFQLGYIC